MVDQSPHRGRMRFLLAMDGLDAALALGCVLTCLLLMRGLEVEGSAAAVASAAVPVLLRRGFVGLPRHLRRVTLGVSSVFSTLFLLGGITVLGLLECQATSRLFGASAQALPEVVAVAGVHALAVPGLVLLVAGVLLSRHAAGECCT